MKKFPEVKEKSKGKFTRWVKKNMPGKNTCDAAAVVMKNAKKYDEDVVKMANYANNFGCSTKGKSPAKIVPLLAAAAKVAVPLIKKAVVNKVKSKVGEKINERINQP